MDNFLTDDRIALSKYREIITQSVSVFSQSNIESVGEQSQQLKNLITLSTRSNDNTIRNQAGAQLREIGENSDPRDHLYQILIMIYHQLDDETYALDELIAYLIGYLRRFSSLENLSITDHLKLLSCTLYCIINKDLTIKKRSKLVFCFEQLILASNTDEDLMKQAIGLFINELLPTLQSFKLIGALLLIQYLQECLGDDDDYIHETSQEIVKVGDKILPYIGSIEGLDYNGASETLKILTLVTKISERIVSKYSAKVRVNLHFNPIISKGFLVFFEKVLSVDFFKGGCCLVCFHADENIRELVNSVKYSIVKTISNIAASNYSRRLEEIRSKAADPNSSAFKNLTLFYGNMISYLLKEISIALEISAQQGVWFTDKVK